METTKIKGNELSHADRLKTLVDWAEINLVNKFYYGMYTSEHDCGTHYCMAGCLPLIFEEWVFDIFKNFPVLERYLAYVDTRGQLSKFFNLNDDEITHLFYPDAHEVTMSLNQVLDRFKKFIAQKYGN